MAAVEKATANFVERGQQIAAENPEIQRDMIEAVHAVQNTGEAMGSAAREFAADPCSSVKRGNMVSLVLYWPWTYQNQNPKVEIITLTLIFFNEN